jgi:hypothetical protein
VESPGAVNEVDLKVASSLLEQTLQFSTLKGVNKILKITSLFIPVHELPF